MMPRRIPQECRIRAIAALHASIGATVIVCAIAWFTTAATHVHGPNDFGGTIIPIVAGLEVIGGAIFMIIACLLWIYFRIAKWTTAVLLGAASALSIYSFGDYTTHKIIVEAATWRRGAESGLSLSIRGGLIEILIVAWSAIVLVALFRSDSREVFSTEYRKSVRADRAIRIPFYSSPFFVVGLVLWLIIGWAASAYR